MEITKQRAQSLRMKIRNANVDITIKVREIETGFSQSETLYCCAWGQTEVLKYQSMTVTSPAKHSLFKISITTSSLISSGNVLKSPYLEQRKPLNQRNFYIKS